jgi:hypothetical protein
MASAEERLTKLEMRVRLLEGEKKRNKDKQRLMWRLIRENHANIAEYLKATLFSDNKDKT